MKRRAVALVVAAVAACAASLAAGVWWVFDLLSHFALQQAVGAALIATACATIRAWRLAAVMAIPLAVSLWQVAPVYRSPEAPAPQGQPLRLMVFNVNGTNDNFAEIASYIEGSGSDIVVVLEVRAGGMDAALSFIAGYRVVAIEARHDNFGIALLSRLETVTAKLVRLPSSDIAAVDAVVPWQGADWHVLGLHVWPPMRADLADERNAALRFAADWARGDGPRVVAGDLNVTPYSPHFREMLSRGELIDSRRGFGIQATWPMRPWFLAWARIPIDHVLHDRSITTLARDTGPPLGSDHLPVIVSLSSTSMPP